MGSGSLWGQRSTDETEGVVGAVGAEAVEGAEEYRGGRGIKMGYRRGQVGVWDGVKEADRVLKKLETSK